MSSTIVTVALAKATLLKINKMDSTYWTKSTIQNFGDLVYRQVYRRMVEISGMMTDNHTLDDNFLETKDSAVTFFNSL